MSTNELCVIYNPTAGKNRAVRRLEAARRAWGDRAAFWPTERPGHAGELARRAADAGFAKIAAAGGDGTVHEVAGGILASGRTAVDFAVIPIGSANDFAFSLFKLPTATEIRVIDVGKTWREDGKSKHFLCNVGLGFNGAVTVEARKIAWLQGMALYGLATLRALRRHYRCPMTTIRIDEEPAWRVPTLMVAVLLGLREGGFVLAPDAKLDDGLLDYVHVGALSRWQVLGLLPRLALFGPPTNHPRLRMGRCRRIEMASDLPVNVHADGEFLCVAEEGFRAITVEVMPAALRVDVALSRRGGMPK